MRISDWSSDVCCSDLLAEAVAILRRHRPDDTPVVLARNLGRPGECVTTLALAELTSDKVDMLTVVLVGSSETRRVARPAGGEWVYTPRGYAGKAQKKNGRAHCCTPVRNGTQR